MERRTISSSSHTIYISYRKSKFQQKIYCNLTRFVEPSTISVQIVSFVELFAVIPKLDHSIGGHVSCFPA